MIALITTLGSWFIPYVIVGCIVGTIAGRRLSSVSRAPSTGHPQSGLIEILSVTCFFTGWLLWPLMVLAYLMAIAGDWAYSYYVEGIDLDG